MIQYKDREVDLGAKVEVYRCLTRKGYIYSVKQFGKVIGHTTEITLRDVTFKVNKSGKKRAIETGIRNVHAMICGYIDNSNSSNQVIGNLKYYPFCNDNFMCNDQEINACNYVTIKENILVAYE